MEHASEVGHIYWYNYNFGQSLEDRLRSNILKTFVFFIPERYRYLYCQAILHHNKDFRECFIVTKTKTYYNSNTNNNKTGITLRNITNRLGLGLYNGFEKRLGINFGKPFDI